MFFYAKLFCPNFAKSLCPDFAGGGGGSPCFFAFLRKLKNRAGPKGNLKITMDQWVLEWP